MALITRPTTRDLRERASGDSWSDERIDLLILLWTEGLSCSQIAKRLGGGHTRCSVGGKARRLNLPARPKTAKKAPKNPRGSLRLVGTGKPRTPRPPPRPPRAIVDPVTWAPLLGSSPRPFWERRLGDCKWPIDCGDEVLSCCLEVERHGYCVTHAAMAFQPARPQPIVIHDRQVRREVGKYGRRRAS